MPRNISNLRDWVISGIVGNGAYAIFITLLGLVVAGLIFVFHEVTQRNLTLYIIIIVLSMLICILTVILLTVIWRARIARAKARQESIRQLIEANNLLKEAQKALEEAQNLADDLNKLDMTLLDLLAFIHSSTQDLDNQMKQVARIIFLLTLKILKDVQSASLFRPDIDRVLTVWAYHELNDDSVKIKCYGGSLPQDDSPRGVAGEAFKERKTIVTHISEHNGEWMADSKSYIFLNREILESKRKIIYPIPYNSMICVPLIQDGYQEPLGVLCFNSNKPEAFNTKEAKDRVQILGDRFISILLMYEKLSQIRQNQPLKTTSIPDS